MITRKTKLISRSEKSAEDAEFMLMLVLTVLTFLAEVGCIFLAYALVRSIF